MRLGLMAAVCLAVIVCTDGFTAAEQSGDIASIRLEPQYRQLQPGSRGALAVHFKLVDDWHFYADPATAPGGMALKINAASEYLDFSEPVFPKGHIYFDKSSEQRLEVYSGEFTVYLPFTVKESVQIPEKGLKANIEMAVEGAVCSAELCRLEKYSSSTAIDIVQNAAAAEPAFVISISSETAPAAEISSTIIALALSVLAGLILNIMPCVWPVIPIIVMRILEQAKESKAKSIGLGLAFCCGILLFFAALAGLNIFLRLGYGTVFQWGDHFRNMWFVLGMAILMVVLSLYMFGVVTVGIPSAIAGRGGSGKGYLSSVGMGFLAAVLSTPCSFAILTAAFAWAQTQKLPLATAAIMLIGAGMAIPYAILTSIPALLHRLPKPGRWMELFKQATGFVLLIIAIKLFEALPSQRLIDVLYFVAILSFCVWMWGQWVSYSTPAVKKFIIRFIAIAIAVLSGLWLLPAPKAGLIDWQPYDGAKIEEAITAGRPVLMDFTADWCLSCKVVEKTVYSRSDIADLIKAKNVLAVKADTTTSDMPATNALKNIYNEPAVPVSMLFEPGKAEPLRFRGLVIKEELTKALRELPDYTDKK